MSNKAEILDALSVILDKLNTGVEVSLGIRFRTGTTAEPTDSEKVVFQKNISVPKTKEQSARKNRSSTSCSDVSKSRGRSERKKRKPGKGKRVRASMTKRVEQDILECDTDSQDLKTEELFPAATIIKLKSLSEKSEKENTTGKY